MAGYLRRTGIWICTLLLLTLSIAAPTLAAPQDHAATNNVEQTGATATVTVNRAILWAGPGRGFWLLGVLFRGDVVPITGVSADRLFWQVSTDKGVGYLMAAEVSAANAGGVGAANTGTVGTITAGIVVVRGGPGFESRRIGSMSRGQQFYVIGSRPDGTWLQIQWRFGKGWVKTSLTNISEEAAAANGGGSAGDGDVPVTTGDPRVIVNAGALHVRSGPGFIYSSLGTVPGGTEMNIVGRTLDGIWLKVESPFGEGWVHIRHVITRDYHGSAPIEGADEESTTYANFKALGGSANIRSGPGIGFDVKYTVYAGTILTITGQSRNGWWRVKSDAGEGWVNKTLGQAFGDVASVPFVD